MKESLEEELFDLAGKYLKKNDGNFIAADIDVPIKFWRHKIEVEYIYYSDEGYGGYYIGCNSKEFSADVNINSLSDKNQKILMKVLKAHI